MTWTRKPTVIAGQQIEDDWIIRYQGRDVGRVYRSHLPEPAHHWFWASWFSPAEQGYAPTLEAALEALRARQN